MVSPDDLALGDRIGVVSIPSTVATEVIDKAEEKLRGEGQVRSDLKSGVSVREVFDRYGIL